MHTKVLICDDSHMARKQLAKALPCEWPVAITYASNGEEALEAIRDGHGELVFLDLNMPVMDGYQVLEYLLAESIPAQVVVVSGDIQPEARNRVMSLGALEFIKKPIGSEEIQQLLGQLQIDTNWQTTQQRAPQEPPSSAPVETTSATGLQPHYRDGYQEVANVAMGQAADLLARVLDVFVVLPIPNVNMIELAELQMALTTTEHETISSVCQGFIGSGIAGEALLIFNDSSFSDIAKLMKYSGEIDEAVELELLMDVGSILIGAFLKGIAEQLDVQFSQGHPVVLGRHVPLDNLLKSNNATWKKTLAIEITYAIEHHNVHCDLLILFTEESLNIMNKKIAYLLD